MTAPPWRAFQGINRQAGSLHPPVPPDLHQEHPPMKAEATVPTGVIPRRRASDWSALTQADRDYIAETELSADRLLARIYENTQVVKLAAFASEARRTLTAIEDTMVYRDEIREELRDNIVGMTEWAEMEDTAAEVLRYTADELRTAAAGLAGLVHDLAGRLVDPVQHQPAMTAA